jgi:phosphoribosylglycinamide formyltransferase 1
MIRKRILIFASGKGSNAMNLIEYFKNKDEIEIVGIVSNNSEAEVLKSARSKKITSYFIENSAIGEAGFLVNFCNDKQIDLIVLAGFLKKIPADLIQKMQNKIVNIHPSLLPKYGGKGMYGLHVHEAVKLANEKETGITIHFVDEVYDTGKIIEQYKCEIVEEDSVFDIQKKVQYLEKVHFPKVIEKVVMGEI